MILLAREVRFAPLEANYSVDEDVLSNSPLQSQMVTAQEVRTQM